MENFLIPEILPGGDKCLTSSVSLDDPYIIIFCMPI